MAGNNYGSIVETFIGGPLLTIDPLSGKATPPADLNIVAADYQPAVDLYGSIAGGLRRGNFALGDVPRIIGVGIWCNMGDGLVQIDNPDGATTGLILRTSARSFNVGNVQVQANLLSPSIDIKVQDFNKIYETSYLLDMTGLDYSLTGNPSASGTGYFRLWSVLLAATMDFSMISVNPDFASQPLYMRPMLKVEHTFPLLTAGF